MIFSFSPAGLEANETEIVLGTFAYPPLMFEKIDNQGRQGIGIDIVKQYSKILGSGLKLK